MKKQIDEVFCHLCGQTIKREAFVCIHCGALNHASNDAQRKLINENQRHSGKNRSAAGFLALFLGSIGAHKFYLGDNSAGFKYMLIFILGSPLIIPSLVIAGIAITDAFKLFQMTDSDFDTKYNSTEFNHHCAVENPNQATKSQQEAPIKNSDNKLNPKRNTTLSQHNSDCSQTYSKLCERAEEAVETNELLIAVDYYTQAITFDKNKSQAYWGRGLVFEALRCTEDFKKDLLSAANRGDIRAASYLNKNYPLYMLLRKPSTIIIAGVTLVAFAVAIITIREKNYQTKNSTSTHSMPTTNELNPTDIIVESLQCKQAISKFDIKMTAVERLTEGGNPCPAVPLILDLLSEIDDMKGYCDQSQSKATSLKRIYTNLLYQAKNACARIGSSS